MVADLPLTESALANPAPFWFLLTLKVLGFTLHVAAMNLWLAGLPIALYLVARGPPELRTFARRLLSQMPIIIALGINFGIVPLLFTQVVYYRFFYPATIFIAWFWFSVIVVLTLSYYGVYFYNVALKRPSGIRKGDQVIGWFSVAGFVYIGFVFSNAMALLSRPDRWGDLWDRTNASGATTGFALNTGDPTVFVRWLLMLALAMMTMAAYAVWDAYFLARAETEPYRVAVRALAFKIYLLGVGAFFVIGALYSAMLSVVLLAQMLSSLRIILIALVAVSPLATLLLLRKLQVSPFRPIAFAVAGAHLVVLLLNAVARQVTQNLELARYADLAREPVRTQWSPLFVFLALLVLGAFVIAWLLRAALRASPTPAE
jgi:hypothetical protein